MFHKDSMTDHTWMENYLGEYEILRRKLLYLYNRFIERNKFFPKKIFEPNINWDNTRWTMSISFIQMLYDFKRENRKKILLLFGETGSGKTTTLMHIERLFWDQFFQTDTVIPVFIDLSETSMATIEMDCLAKLMDFRPREDQQVVVLLDGYDKIKGLYYESSDDRRITLIERLIYKFIAVTGSRIKFIVTCDTNFFASDNTCPFMVKSIFPYGPFYIEPFTSDQVNEYVSTRIEKRKNTVSFTGKPIEYKPGGIDDALKVFEKYGLRELVKNPLILGEACDLLEETGSLNRWDFYQTLTSKWFLMQAIRSKQQIKEALTHTTSVLKTWFKKSPSAGNVVSGMHKFAVEAAVKMYETKKGRSSVPYDEIYELYHYKINKNKELSNYFSQEPITLALRKSCMIKMIQDDLGPNSFAFYHDSLHYYFMAFAFLREIRSKKFDITNTEALWNRLKITKEIGQFIADYIYDEKKYRTDWPWTEELSTMDLIKRASKNCYTSTHAIHNFRMVINLVN